MLSRRRLACAVFDTLATRSGLAHNVIHTDCCYKARRHPCGGVSRLYKQWFSTHRIKNRV